MMEGGMGGMTWMLVMVWVPALVLIGLGVAIGYLWGQQRG